MKTARFAIFLTGIIGLGLGGLISISSLQSQRDTAALELNDHLKTQAQSYADQFFSVVDSIRSGGNPDYVFNRVTVSLDQGIPAEIETPIQSLSATSDQTDLTLEDRLLNALKNQVKLNDLKLQRFSIGTFEVSEIGNKEGVFIAIPSETDAQQGIRKISVTLLDPQAALNSFSKISNPKLNRNAYLVSKTGKVLAHTSSAYVGTDFRKTEGLKETLENLFNGNASGVLSHYQSIDGVREQVAFIRTGTLPFAVGVEQKAVPAVASLNWFEEGLESGAVRRGIGMVFLVISLALALFAGVSHFFNRRIQKEIKILKFQNRSQVSEPEKQSVPRMEVPLPLPNVTLEKAAETFTQTRDLLREEFNHLSDSRRALSEQVPASPKILVHRDYAAELISTLKSSTQPEQIEKNLVKLASEMSESPTLYLRYQRRQQNLTLAAVAGKTDIHQSALYQVYVRKDIEEQIEFFAKEGKVASLNNYSPMSKMMLTNLNIAHFESWAVTSESEVSGEPRLLGVLVILNAGIRSAESRPILSRMLKESGNYLFALNHKINQRSRNLQLTPSIHSELNT